MTNNSLEQFLSENDLDLMELNDELLPRISSMRPIFQPVIADEQGRLDKRIRSPVLSAAMSLSPNTLRIDWCSYDAAKYAVRHWHYSRSLPCSKTARLGVWGNDRFIGAIIFAWGANRHFAGEYKLKMTESAELCRIALDKHSTPVSRIISIAVRMLKREMPGLRLLVSYADLNQGHEGKIYQASNWMFVGRTGYETGITLNGMTHRRTINSKYGTSDIQWLRKSIDPTATRYEGKPKFKYLLPLDDEISERLKSLSKPYPQTRATSKENVAPGVHSGEGGVNPTVALQKATDLRFS